MQSVRPRSDFRFGRLLLFGVECIRGPFIRLNGEELCSTANRRQVEVYVGAWICQGTGAIGIHGIGARVRHAERFPAPSNVNTPTAALPKVFFPVTERPGAFAPLKIKA